MTGKRTILLLLATLILWCLGLTGGVQAGVSNFQNTGPEYVPGEVLVKFRGTSAPGLAGPLRGAALAQYVSSLPPEARAALQRIRGTAARGFPRLGVLHVQFPPDVTVPQAIETLAADSAVEYAEPNFVMHAVRVPQDPDFSLQWGLKNTGQTGGTRDADIDAPQAWTTQRAGAGAVVGLIDTGVDYSHPDLVPSMWTNPQEIAGNLVDDDANGWVDDVHGINTVAGTGNPMDDAGHGTHTAGIIGARGNNSIGVCGVTWKARIMALKFLGSNGSGTLTNAITCIEYALAIKDRQKYPRMILSNSWGSYGNSNALFNAIKLARDAGVLFIAAAGNDALNNDSTPFYPASYQLDNIISVGASDKFDHAASFSNFGLLSVHLYAPGVTILSTFPGNQYAYMDGTSMACPHVSGACALIWSANKGLDWVAIKARVLNWVDQKPDLNQCVTGGRLNLYRSLLGP
jgi:subtilisin family serine protease